MAGIANLRIGNKPLLTSGDYFLEGTAPFMATSDPDSGR